MEFSSQEGTCSFMSRMDLKLDGLKLQGMYFSTPHILMTGKNTSLSGELAKVQNSWLYLLLKTQM